MSVMNEYIVDLFEFARTGRVAEGDVQLAALPRMVTEVPAEVSASGHAQGVFHWRAEGAEKPVLRADGKPTVKQFLTLTVEGPMWLECQRCLTPYQESLDSETTFEIVPDEAAAEARPLDEDELEALVGSKHFDLRELIEEELLLALPIVPKHEVCPSVHDSLATGSDGLAAPAPEPEEEDKPSPFAALAALKRSPDKDGK
ncbi:YceD family protein [Pandoraea oxalativorans]|uniref:Large ribosomal RNA subunit accumulation protein YceD n=1 Tax=Pandoraea oxalativorans TaxID=573737 RepID=A0A0E3U508_9BURK|nr:YceD family protein [Pandoraea oxalativorans]AKC68218.1 metal-binding protein [Pandoraea oxalativorans]